MGRIVYAAAMSHVLYPDYYGKNVGPHGRRMVEELLAVVRDMGRDMLAAKPDALLVIADDHLNVFSFDALDGLPERYPLHEDLANRVLEQGMEAGFDFAASWSAPLDHAFLSPVSTLCGAEPVPPLVPVWVNCFIAPQPTARRCFAAGSHIARVVAEGPLSRYEVNVPSTASRRIWPSAPASATTRASRSPRPSSPTRSGRRSSAGTRGG